MIRLEKFDHNCYDQLISWADSTEALMQFAGPAFTFPLTHEQLNNSLSDNNRFAFQVIDTRRQTTIGHAEIYLSEQSAFLGRILIGDKELRGMGIGQQIVYHLLDFAFKDLKQQIVELNVFDWNVSAIKCYEKAGFVFNLSKRAERKVNGQTWIALNMYIDKQKWELFARAL
ncbi:MAG TPA: GNAT family protein [Hanamia sp.]|nr:GNAT family protein [Hanamia sp.]